MDGRNVSGYLVQKDQAVTDVGCRLFITWRKNVLSSQIPVPPSKWGKPSPVDDKAAAIFKFSIFVGHRHCGSKSLYSTGFVRFQQLLELFDL